jgi:hypothetical protein
VAIDHLLALALISGELSQPVDTIGGRLLDGLAPPTLLVRGSILVVRFEKAAPCTSGPGHERAIAQQAEKSAMVYTVIRPTELVALATLSTAKQVPEQQRESGHADEHRDGQAPVRQE